MRWIVFALLALLAAPLWAQQSAQPAPKKEKHVITEDDLSSSSEPDKPDSADKQDEDKKDGDSAEPDDSDKRSDVEKAQDEVKKWDNEEKMLERKLATLQEKANAETSEFRKQMYLDAINNQQVTLQEHKDKKAAAEKRLEEAKQKEGQGDNK